MKKRGSVVLEVGDRDETLLTSAAGGEAPFRIKDILVPIDFSECSKKALRYAIPLAKAQGAKLTLLNVVPSHSAMGQTAGVDFTAITSPLRAAAQKRLAALAADEVKGEVLAKSFVRAGLPSAEVLAEARSLPADLIVISTHGHTGVTHLILGSVVEHVVRAALRVRSWWCGKRSMSSWPGLGRTEHWIRRTADRRWDAMLFILL